MALSQWSFTDSTMVNSVTYGVNNIASEISGTNIVVARLTLGQNINNLGSLNQIKQSNDAQVIDTLTLWLEITTLLLVATMI